MSADHAAAADERAAGAARRAEQEQRIRAKVACDKAAFEAQVCASADRRLYAIL